MSNKQRRAWRPWAFLIVLFAPLILAGWSWVALTDGSWPALARELDQVAVGLWFILLAAAWLRARAQESRALRHAVAVRARKDVDPNVPVAVEATLLRAQDDLATVNVMWQAFFVVFGLLRLLLHFSAPLIHAGWSVPD